MAVPIYVSRVKVGRGRDMVLVSVECPSGDTARGEVENQEAVRMVMSLSTFVEVAELFSVTAKQITGAKAASVGIHSPVPDPVPGGDIPLERFSIVAGAAHKH